MPRLLCPYAASAAKLKFETAISTRLMSTDRFMPRLAYIAPPTNTPASSAMKPTPTS